MLHCVTVCYIVLRCIAEVHGCYTVLHLVTGMKKAHGIIYSDLDMTEVIGLGGFGVVYRATWKSRRMIVAVKKIITLDSQVMGLKEVGTRSLGSTQLQHVLLMLRLLEITVS